VPAAALAWGIAALAVCLPESSGWLACALWVVAVACLPFLARASSQLPAVAVVALIAAATVSSHVALAQPGRTAVAEVAAGTGRAVVIDAVISGKLESTGSGDLWFDAVAGRVAAGAHSFTGAQPVRIGVGVDDVPALAGADVGTTIVVGGTTIPRDPGDRAAVIVRAHDITVEKAPAAPPLEAAASLRHSLLVSAAGLPQPGSALVPGLAVGDTSAVDAALDASMKASSLSHLTAVSGANCAIVVGLAFGAAALCGARRGARVAAALATLAGFVLLVTPEPSVVRAGAMAAVAMLALALGRAGAGLNVLCLAVVVLLAVDPWLALSLGFGLSTAATASLLVLARPLATGLERWMPRALALVLAVPLAAQLACGPLLVLIDPRVPLLGVAANLLAAPAAPLATLAGFAACLAAPLPWLQDGLVAIAWVPASWIAGVAQVSASFPAQQLPWLDGVGGMLALAAVSAAIAAVIIVRPGRASGGAVRAVAWVMVCAVVGIGGGQSVLRTIAGPWTLPAEWSVAACDIGQGDAVLLRSAGAVALVDTGPDPALLSACLDRFGLARIDLLVLTHFDLDHVGGVPAVVGRVGLVLHGPPDGVQAQHQLDDLAEAGATVRTAEPGMQGLLGEARWRVLWPADAVAPGNDASVVLDVRGGELPSTLLLGDLSAEAQRSMQRTSPLGAYEVVKVAHHGSADQDPGLYATTHPLIGVIPVGQDNDYGHPRDSLLAMLTALGTVVARTDEEGVIVIWRESGGGLNLWRERGVAPGG
jgi:competence protein ComEC